MKTKEKVLLTSIELFNRSGVGPMTTNHIAKAMAISPGNLYFHYENKEQILRELFTRMCKETYQIWKPKRSTQKSILQFVEENFELYWKFRFFHREMYSLRRKDAKLAKMWRAHLQKMVKLMQILYRHWTRQGLMVEVKNQDELVYISESLLAMATTYLQFFESAEKTPGKRSIERGKKHLVRLLSPYAVGESRDELEKFMGYPAQNVH